MPTAFLYPNVGALWLAGIVQTAMAGCTVDLFQAGTVTLGPATTLADLTAVGVLADYTGYTQITVAAWLGPYLAPGGGSAIDSGENFFLMGAPYTNPNTIQGWFITEAGGELVCAGDFSALKSFVGAGDAASFIVVLPFGG